MEKVIEYTYLGGIISDSGTNGKKVESARNKGIGTISTIMSILKDVSLALLFSTAQCPICLAKIARNGMRQIY